MRLLDGRLLTASYGTRTNGYRKDAPHFILIQLLIAFEHSSSLKSVLSVSEVTRPDKSKGGSKISIKIYEAANLPPMDLVNGLADAYVIIKIWKGLLTL